MDPNVHVVEPCVGLAPATGAAGRVFPRVGPTRRLLPQRRQPARCPVFARAAQVAFPDASPPNTSLLAKLSKAAVIVPAIGIALFSCSNAHARPAPAKPTISTSQSVTNTSSAASNFFASASATTSTLFASASAAMGNPKVRGTLLAVTLAAAATAATRHSQNRKSIKAKAADEPGNPPENPPSKPEKQTVPDPGVIVLGLAGLLIDAMSNPPKTRSSRISSSIVEAEPAEKKSNVVALDDSERMAISDAKKYDLFVELMNAGNNLVEDPKYDPIRSMLAEASKSVTSFTRSFISSIEWRGDDRYDLIHDLFTRMKTEGFSKDPKYDPLYRALKMEPPSGYKRFDPLGGIVKVVRAPVNFVANKFDFLTGFFKGKWQSENEHLDNLPEWDPVSDVHAAAGQPVAFDDSKYDPAVTASRREWLAGNSTTRDVPKWDPISGVKDAARRPMAFDKNSYDVAEVVLRGEWLKVLSSLSDLPSWDPASKLVEIAKGTEKNTSPAKYDAIPSLLYGKWRGAFGDESWEDESKSVAQVQELDDTKQVEEEDVMDQHDQIEEISQDMQISEEIIEGMQISESMQISEEVIEGTQISESMQISEEIIEGTQISESTQISEEIIEGTQISESTQISEEVIEGTQISESMQISEEIIEGTQISESMQISKSMQISEDTQIIEGTQISEDTQISAIVESPEVEEPLKSQAELDAEKALIRQLQEEEAQEAARLEAEIAKIASESVAERIVSSKIEADSDKEKMQMQTKAFESKTRVLKSIAALIREFESVQQMDVLKT